jgi:hypothetical protein
MGGILIRIVNHVHDHLAGSAKLHGAEGEGRIGTERLMEYSPAQTPVVTVALECKVKSNPYLQHNE